jgi:cation diffusion facilitator family transporter
MKRGLIRNREQAQVFTGVFSIAINAVLFVIKLLVGLTTGSIALVADAWHTMSDSLTSVLTVVAAKLASKKPDKEHPFGHGRWEIVASFIMAFVLAFIGYEFLTSSIDRFNERETVVFGTLALTVTIASIVVKELLAQFSFYLGRKFNNPVIIAEGWHSRSDSLSSIVVLAGIVITRFFTELWWMDSVLGIFCALAIFYAAFKVMKDAIKNILGEEPKQEFIAELQREVRKI